MAADKAVSGEPEKRDDELPAMEVTVGASELPLPADSRSTLDRKALFDSHVFTVNEALRKIPGVYVRDEEGFGIRPNIGIRGQNPFRSTKQPFQGAPEPFLSN